MTCSVCGHDKDVHTGKTGPGRACSVRDCLCDVFLASLMTLGSGDPLKPRTIFRDDKEKVKIVREWLQKLAAVNPDDFTPWEKNFLKDIRLKAAFGIARLTDEQIYWIERIYAEKTA